MQIDRQDGSYVNGTEWRFYFSSQASLEQFPRAAAFLLRAAIPRQVAMVREDFMQYARGKSPSLLKRLAACHVVAAAFLCSYN